jgi:molybdenum cofactor biosynthesis protein B
MSHTEHRESAPARVSFAVVTVSDTRDGKADVGGRVLKEMITGAGHALAGHLRVKDDAGEIGRAVSGLLDSDRVDLIVLTGGSGIARRDVTVEAVRPLIEKEIVGFGELFRQLSYMEIGSAAMLSRATAGAASGKVLFVLPGSVKAVRLAMERLILPEAGHLVLEVRK